MSNFKNVLLVEDDKDDQEFFAEMFHEVAPDAAWTITDNGQHALEWLLKSLPHRPDLIFLDLNMPLIDGFEFLRIIKSGGKYEPFRHIPVMVLSTANNYMERCYALGANKYLVKPYSVQEFRAMLTDVLIDSAG
jgi:CheY-like chemotaxis protein